MDYCEKIVRKNDRDRYILSLGLNKAARKDIWPLFAFNFEIAKTREVVTETQLGLIRLQWWRDRLDEFYKEEKIAKHEVLEPLCDVISRYNLPQDLFENLIYAREFDLEDRMPANIEGLINYIDFTNTPLNQMVLMVLGQDQDKRKDTARSVSILYGVQGVLKAVPFHASQGRCYLPEDLMKAEGLRKTDLHANFLPEGVTKIVRQILEVVEAGEDSNGSESAYLNLVSDFSDIYIGRIKSMNYDIYNARLLTAPPLFLIKLLLGLYKG